MATYTVDYTGIPGHVYTLLLESGRFYVGWSSAVENRIAQHFSGAGSKWTIQHKPLQVLACVAGDTRLEDVVTISLMCQHGWERVRGGRWCQLDLEGPPDAVRRRRVSCTGAQTLAAQRTSTDLNTLQIHHDCRGPVQSRDHPVRPTHLRGPRIPSQAYEGALKA